MNLPESLDIEAPVNFSGLGDVEGLVELPGPVVVENWAFALRLVDVREPVDF